MTASNVILVVDDDTGMLRGLGRVLKAHGFGVELFESIHDFRSRANLHNAACLVLDIHLDGVSGIDLRRQLALAGFSVPVIFITADDSDATQKIAREAGCVAFLLKPFPSRLLVDAIERATAGKNEEPRPAHRA